MASSLGDVIAVRRFEVFDQRWFAEASGDYNPLHTDDLAARRSIFGRTVVHGVHALLWALDAFLADRRTSVERISVVFRRPIFLDEEVEVVVAHEDDRRAEVQVRHESVVLLAARFDLAPASLRLGGRLLACDAEDGVSQSALDLDANAIAAASGHIPPYWHQRALHGVFRAAVNALGEDTVSLISSLSRLVGMECPGLHSLFAGFDVVLAAQDSDDGLRWTVKRFDDRVGAVRMEVRGPSLIGTVDAFVRPRPVEQPSCSQLHSLVDPKEFADMRALIVGGSRGLGEITAKLVSAGGGDSVITWHRGEEDACAVVDDIREAGGTARAIWLDASRPGAALGAEDPVPTHLFYFATPRISASRASAFDEALFRGFFAVYGTGFVGLLQALRVHGATRLAVFYPSTVFVDQPSGFAEYAAAKAAGEIVARSVGEFQPGLRVLVERLPRMRTDQTESLLAAQAEAPEHLMLQQIRRLSAL